MKIIPPSVKIEQRPHYKDMLSLVESAARTCYKSEPKGDAAGFIRKIIAKGHESVLEHVSICVRIVCDRGVSHELVRHRTGIAFSQESTRYVRYDKADMEFIEPWWWSACADGDIERSIFEGACHDAESRYLAMLACGAAPQAARAVLPNALKTEVVVTANLREWRHVFRLRLDRAAHPDMRRVMGLVFEKFATEYPVFFEDLCQKRTTENSSGSQV